MKKITVVALCTACFSLVAGCASFPFGRTERNEPTKAVRTVSGMMPTLGILPFSAAGQDGETVATLFSHEEALRNTFRVVPRTTALDVILQNQGSSFVESNDIRGILSLLNAEFVLSGSIKRLGDRNLLIATIINVETFELVAGYYRTYREIGEVPSFLPLMAKNLVETFSRENRHSETLSILPFRTQSGISRRDLETLAEIMAIELLVTGKYSVLPRTAAIEAAIAEQRIQMSGITETGSTARIGGADNAMFVLDGTVNRLGEVNIIAAQVLRAREGSLVSGKRREYDNIADAVELMAELAIELAEPDGAVAAARIAVRRQQNREARAAEEELLRRRQAEIDAATRRIQAEANEKARIRQAEIDAERRKEANRQANRERIANAKRNEWEGFSLAYVMAEDGKRTGFSVGLILSGLYFSPLPFTNIGVETSVTTVADGNFVEVAALGEMSKISFFGTVSPTVGTLFPLSAGARLFVNAKLGLDLGSVPWEGMLLHNRTSDTFGVGLTPGFNTGLSFGKKGTFTMKYGLSFYKEGTLAHYLGLNFGGLR
ncbi:MAG: trichohyalin-plectin-homology domain domain-containing protein [Treponema sp.]|nr:trichohyalin-plectin-homology domain domain-containing protein [Treponema sp.]